MRPRRRNRTVYTGRVGAKMPPPSAKRRAARRLVRLFECLGGPFEGQRLALDARNPGTLPLRVGAHCGRYVSAQNLSNVRWEAAA